MFSCLVKTRSCYATILDRQSPANVAGFFQRELEAARRDANLAGDPSGFELFRLNDRLLRRSEAGEFLAWTLLFDGVFRAELRIGSLENLPPPQPQGVGSSADLWFPSGEVLVTCLGRTGDAQTETAIDVKPGRYRVHAEQRPCEEDHWFLEDLRDYPESDGPDWTLTLALLSAD